MPALRCLRCRDVPMGAEGKLSFAATITEAVEGADYIQESVSNGWT